MTNQKYLQKLQNYFQKNKIIPSYSQLRNVFQVKSKNTCFNIVNQLINKKYLQKRPDGKLIPTDKFTLKGISLYSEIRAGFPSPAEEDIEDTISLDEFLIEHPNETVLIRVKGDSMIEKGIFQGDIVIVRRGIQTQENDIVVASVDGDFTLKILIKNKGKFILKAGNKKYPNIQAEEELQIHGKVVGVIRKY